MKRFFSVIIVVSLMVGIGQAQSLDKETIKITGQVTDFNGLPIDSAAVELFNKNFDPAYSTYSDAQGNFELKGIKKGKYIGLYVIRPKEYPRGNQVPDADKRLEFWAWNVVADRDLVINPRYHRLELYGTRAFKIEGAQPGLMVYTRPMSLSKVLGYSAEIYTNKERIDKEVDVSVDIDDLKFEVYADGKPLKINSIQAVREYAGDRAPMIAYLMHVDYKKSPKKPVCIRVVGENTQYNEKGENIFFYEPNKYE